MSIVYQTFISNNRVLKGWQRSGSVYVLFMSTKYYKKCHTFTNASRNNIVREPYESSF